ncbi:EbsA family protein [Latilactobacillus sakei]|uniref:EbsA family protein n=1 Tax=Latilactobacillus sakei TaxID=1599 RepID=A0AAF0GRE2_LATSK|nr:EbsA family protein [Latilactobacillus sakei]WGI18221.1 EbsA family protein [Latilactobacillus sakei]
MFLLQTNKRLFYQPNYAYCVTIWSWIGFIYTLALILQLELINLNWQSITVGIIAVLLTIINLFGHRLDITAQTLTLKRPLFKYNRTIQLAQTTAVIVQKHGLLIKTTELDYQPEQLLLSAKVKEQLITTLEANNWPVQNEQ